MERIVEREEKVGNFRNNFERFSLPTEPKDTIDKIMIQTQSF